MATEYVTQQSCCEIAQIKGPYVFLIHAANHTTSGVYSWVSWLMRTIQRRPKVNSFGRLHRSGSIMWAVEMGDGGRGWYVCVCVCVCVCVSAVLQHNASKAFFFFFFSVSVQRVNQLLLLICSTILATAQQIGMCLIWMVFVMLVRWSLHQLTS